MHNQDIISNRFIRKLARFPYPLAMVVIAMCSFGAIILFSATGGDFYPRVAKQIIFYCMFLPVLLLVALIDIRKIFNNAYFIFFGCLFFLILVELFGHSAMGAKRWINLFVFNFQPSETAKIAVILALARYFHCLDFNNLGKIRYLIVPILMALVPIGLIIKQPDLGTGLLCLFVAGTIFFAAGVRLWKFIAAFIGVSACLPIIWRFLHDYQKKRILVFLDPEADPLGSGYNIIQSKIAIGSGGFFGKGYMQGSQSQLSFIPEHQTDFIFPTIAEEHGFLGGSLVILLFSCLVIYGTLIAVNCRSTFARLIAVGGTSLIFFHAFINMGMVMGLVPVVGVPLPFFSYGGTIIATCMVAIGLIINAHLHSSVNISDGI